MTEFHRKKFHVETSNRAFATCNHGWVNAKNTCVFCGGKVCNECGGEGYVVFPVNDDDSGMIVQGRDQCPNRLCDRGFTP